MDAVNLQFQPLEISIREYRTQVTEPITRTRCLKKLQQPNSVLPNRIEFSSFHSLRLVKKFTKNQFQKSRERERERSNIGNQDRKNIIERANYLTETKVRNLVPNTSCLHFTE